MPALQSIVLTDRQATPVNYTLLPIGGEGGVYSVAVADASGVTMSQRRLSISRRVGADRVKSTHKFRFPVMATETINGVAKPYVLREAYIDVTFNFSKYHTEAERNDVIGQFQSAYSATKVLTHDQLVKDQAVW